MLGLLNAVLIGFPALLGVAWGDGNAADAVLLSGVAGGLLAGLALLVAVGVGARSGLVGALCAALAAAFAVQAAMTVVERAAWARYGVALAPAFAGLGIAVWCVVDTARAVRRAG